MRVGPGAPVRKSTKKQKKQFSGSRIVFRVLPRSSGAGGHARTMQPRLRSKSPAKAPSTPHSRSTSPSRPAPRSKSPSKQRHLQGKTADKASQPAALRLFLCLFPSGNYGVVILAASAVGTVAGAAGHSFILGCFTDALMTDVGLARSTVATCFTVAIIVSALYSNVIGAAVDRVGPRLLVSVAALPYAAAIASMSLVSDAQSLQLSMLAIRMLGPETIDFACRAAVTQWWVARRGIATGVLNLVGASTSTLPALIAMAMEAHGWRATLWWMAVLMGSAALAVSVLLLHKPEDYGLRPDTGCRRPPPPSPRAPARQGPGPGPEPEPEPEPELRVREALGTSGFWLLALYYLLCGGLWNALNFHMGAVLDAQPLDATLGGASARSLLYLPMAAASAVCALAGGALADALPASRKQMALAAPAIAMGLCLAALGSGGVTRGAHLLGVGVGLGCYQGLDKTIPTVVTGGLFGRRSNGQITALYLVTRQLAGALGVQALGAVMDTAGSLGRVLSMGAVLLALLAAIAIWSTPRLQRKEKAG